MTDPLFYSLLAGFFLWMLLETAVDVILLPMEEKEADEIINETKHQLYETNSRKRTKHIV